MMNASHDTARHFSRSNITPKQHLLTWFILVYMCLYVHLYFCNFLILIFNSRKHSHHYPVHLKKKYCCFSFIDLNGKWYSAHVCVCARWKVQLPRLCPHNQLLIDCWIKWYNTVLDIELQKPWTTSKNAPYLEFFKCNIFYNYIINMAIWVKTN